MGGLLRRKKAVLFLKKRTKKLLLPGRALLNRSFRMTTTWPLRRRQRSQKFLASFFQKRRPSFLSHLSAASKETVSLPAASRTNGRHRRCRRMDRLWTPRRVLATPSALALPEGRAMADRAVAAGAELVALKADRLTGLPDAYRDAKTTMALVTASPSRRRLQPIPPSADWRFDLAEGLPGALLLLLPGGIAGRPAHHKGVCEPGRHPGPELPAAVGRGPRHVRVGGPRGGGHHVRVLHATRTRWRWST